MATATEPGSIAAGSDGRSHALAYGKPCAVTLLSCVVALYVTFSPMGLVAGGSIYFGDILLSLAALNALLWLWWYRRLHHEPEAN